MKSHIKRIALALSLLMVGGAAATAVAGGTYGMFVLKTDPANAYLPSSLRLNELPEVELLHPKRGLNLCFTDFEFRNKFYREENRYVWEGKADPRFVTDVPDAMASPVPTTAGDYVGESVSYDCSYAQVKRSLLFHATAPVMRIVYGITANRDIVIHMPCMFNISLQLGETLNRSEILDERNPADVPLAFDGSKTSRTLLNMGPVAISDKEGKLSVLVSHTVTGDLPAPLPFRMIDVKKGQQIVLTLEIECFRDDHEGMLKKMSALHSAMDTATVPCRLYATGHHLLFREKHEAEGEALLLQAAQTAPEWYLPYMMIAEYRLQNNINGLVRGTTKGQNYYEAAFRMPWNYGVILRGGDYLGDERLSEAQQRLLLFNLMCALENTLFYPNYYANLAGPFERRKMYAQACAIYRQALWAVDYYPMPEAKREKTRAGFRKKIAALEEKLITTITAAPPAPIAVRPQGE